MYDSLPNNFNILLVGDTALTFDTIIDSSAVAKLIPGNFLQTSNINITPELLVYNSNFDIITYVVIALIGFISVIWYVIPDRFLTIFSLKSISKIQRDGDSASKKPGLILTSFFWLNFIITLSIFLFLVLHEFFVIKMSSISDYIIIKNILVVIVSLFLYRFFLGYATAFIFQTQKLLKQQAVIDRNIQLSTGILLLPIILLMLYANNVLMMYIVVSIIALLQVYRLGQMVIIGKSNVVFSALHIILYLCALEIVPVLVLLRLINNYSVV